MSLVSEEIEGLARGLGAACGRQERSWVRCLAEAADAGFAAVSGLLGTERGREVLGCGEGGDQTIRLDAAAEDAILGVLGRLAPLPFHLVTEEAGMRTAAVETVTRVVVDPVDGSLNAKRGLEPCCAALAVAEGDTLGDVGIGYVRDFARGHHYLAVRGAGFVCSRRVEPVGPGVPIELILLEAGRPSVHTFCLRDMAGFGGDPSTTGLRVRVLGSVALSLCQVALGVADLLVVPVPSRSVDVAGALLMVLESGGGAADLDADSDGSELWRQPLDLQRRAPLVAWRRGLSGEAIVEQARRLVPR